MPSAPFESSDPILDQLRRTAEQFGEAVAIAQSDGTLVYTNAAFDYLYGYDKDELLNRSLATLFADADTGTTFNQILQTARARGAWEGTITHRRKDGTAVTSYAILTMVQGSQGEAFLVTKHPLRSSGSLPTEAWDTHEQILQLAKMVPGIVYRCQNDPHWTMRALSGEVEAITGYPPDALINNREVTFADLIHPADRTQVWESVQRQLADSGTFRAQYRLNAADGSERVVREKGQSIGLDPEGVELLEGSILDITEQQESQRRLAAMEVRYRQLFEGLNDAAFVHSINPDGSPGRFLEVNRVACERLGYTQEEFLGMTPADVDLKLQQGQLSGIADRIGSEGSLIFETEHVARDGSVIPVELSTRLMDFNGETMVLSLARDLRDRKARDRMVTRLEWAVNLRMRVTRAVTRAVSEQGLFQDVVEGIAWAGEFPLAWIYRPAGGRQEGLQIDAVYLGGDGRETLDPEAFRMALQEAGTEDPQLDVLESGQETTTTFPEGHPKGWQGILNQHGFRSVALLPLKYNEEILALLGLASEEPATFEHTGQFEVLKETTFDLGFAIQALDTWTALQENLQKREQGLSDTVHSMARIVDERDPYTAGHQDRVAQLSVAIAREMGLDEDRIQGLQLGAWIHDIGKLKVPTDILNKPGQLSRHEFAIIQEHTEAGSRILQGIEFPWPIQEMVRYHHERLDGSGYPDGLTGDQIALEVRILAVADVVEAVTSHRPYRPARGLDKALGILRADRGEKLDPEAVDACLALLEGGRFQWEDEEGDQT